MIFPRPPLLLRLLTHKLVTWRIPGKEKCIYLTFDDGPIPEVTPWILETLAAYNAKATFFCVGENVARHPELYQQILTAGHRTGNHTYHHIQGWKTPYPHYLEDVDNAHQLINSTLYRPPHGQLTFRLIRELRHRFTIVLWSVLSYDFDRSLTPEKSLSIVLRHAKAGDIVVFHDSLKAEPRMKFALKGFLEHFASRGYVFHTLPPKY